MGEWAIPSYVNDFKSLTGNIYIEVPSPDGTANVKGDWIELEDSLPFATGCIAIMMAYEDELFLLDIAVGPAESEVIIVENIPVGYGPSINCFGRELYVILPFNLPAGTRLSARSQRAIAADGIVYLRLFAARKGSFFLDEIVIYTNTIGAVTASTTTVQIDPGATADTKGAYAQITASTPIRSDSLILAFDGRNDGSLSTCVWAVDIAIGASGSEQIIIADFIAVARSQHDGVSPRYSFPFPIPIPVGTRVAARAKSNETGANRGLGVGIILL
jgi:hypothetical protein